MEIVLFLSSIHEFDFDAIILKLEMTFELKYFKLACPEYAIMSLIVHPEIEGGKIRNISVEVRYPSEKKDMTFYDGLNDCKISSDLPSSHRGLFYLVSFKPSKVVMARDVLGSKPLYYNNKLEVSSFSKFVDSHSEIMAGEYIEIGYDGEIIKQSVADFFDVFRIAEFDYKTVEEKIVKSLEKAKIGNACISFSGGVDSSLLSAFYDVPLIAVTASKDEKERIVDSAKRLGKEVEIFEFDEEIVAREIKDVVNAIETTNPLQVSIAVPIYLAMKFARNLGFNEIIFGQGADELFGGYKRYENVIGKNLEKAIIEDVRNLGQNNLVRDTKISYYLQMKIITPYLDFDIIESALSIPPNLKVKREGGVVTRKYFLRELARKFIPHEVAYKEKKAIQYSTKTYSILEKLAKKSGKSIPEFLKGL